MSNSTRDALVEPTWLAANLGRDEIAILDGTWVLPPTDRDARAEYAADHISGAVYFDIDQVVDPANPLPHTLPPAQIFADEVGKMGIANDSHIVVYEAASVFAAARVWWMFRAMGHARVSVLDGGLRRWRAEGYATTDKPTRVAQKPYEAALEQSLLSTLDDVRNNLKTNDFQVLDARSSGRFNGIEAESRPGLRSGHIPGAKNLPYAELMSAADGRFADPQALQAMFVGAGVDLDRRVVTTCGSGVSACILGLGLHLLGHSDWAVYDGSWTEWGAQPDTEVEV